MLMMGLMTTKSMMKNVALGGVLLTICALTGCSSQGGGGAMTKDEESNFKGGPMPASVAAGLKNAPHAAPGAPGATK